ncbi:RNA methyltransferase [Arcanobacterium hippocoleae]|uniref:tRNA G18 (Ribose-2'-O)-methylase SpoU n=1 Tax=Arcanobacterium hippocoleae TaxID=149017 RepID=A0ABU1T194_9ACTO|nr:RNA methyltransferase [Arcanobacterium hippocoleae]MDR6938625.1 tRNA G18 (ribose-2'-O)-methylase SpoU [Arcanobacterium hippocoleae]
MISEESGKRVQIVQNVCLDDPRLADFTKLTDVALRRKLETERGLYLAEGLKVIARAMSANHLPRAILSAEKWLPEISQILAHAEFDTSEVPVFVVDEAQIHEITGFRIHRGAMAAMNRPALESLDKFMQRFSASRAARIFILEDLVDHTNVGAIFRSAAALGVDGILVTPSCADPLYRRSIKVAMGNVFQIPWTRLENWPNDLEKLHQDGWISAALALRPDSLGLRDFAQLPQVRAENSRIALVLGTEGDGLSNRTIAATTHRVIIPMQHGVDSLNVAAAGALAAWELQAEK